MSNNNNISLAYLTAFLYKWIKKIIQYLTYSKPELKGKTYTQF